VNRITGPECLALIFMARLHKIPHHRMLQIMFLCQIQTKYVYNLSLTNKIFGSNSDREQKLLGEEMFYKTEVHRFACRLSHSAPDQLFGTI
jgi:hypothetical protein